MNDVISMIVYMIIVIFGIAILLPILFLVYLELSSPAPPTTTGTTLKDREGVVIKDIKPENISGKVKIKNSSQIWSATATKEIEEGAEVKINEVEGVHLKVEKIFEEKIDVPEAPEEIPEEVPKPHEEVPEWKEEVPEPPEEITKPLEEEEMMVSEEEELVELESDVSESQVCPSCETIITLYVERCPICDEELETDEDLEGKGFFRFFDNMIGSLRG